MEKRNKQLADWRRQGHGIWWITFIVIGEDPEFQIPAPGKWSERFAKARARIDLAQYLNVSYEFVIFKSIRKEGP